MPRRIITATLIVTIAVAALSGSAMAYAVGPGFGVGHSTQSVGPAYSRQDKQVIPPATYTAQPVARVSTPTGGFTALDTALVAAGSLALLLLVAGGTAVLLRRRDAGPRHPAAVTR